jgi:glutathione S-transferase
MEMEMMKLYGAPPTRALRVIWLLNELGLEYEMLPVDVLQGENQQEDFLTLNPAAKLPVLVDGSVVVTESSAIQLCHSFVKPPFFSKLTWLFPILIFHT